MAKHHLTTRRVRAQPGLAYPAPRFSEFAYQLTRTTMGLYLRLFEGVRRVELIGAEHLVDAYQRFYDGEARVLIAFRHGAAEDATVLVQAVCRELPREARRLGRPLGGRAHAHFVYGRPVLFWGGPVARWSLPRLAGLAVMNRKADRRAVAAIRRCLLDGDFPMALAPEGQVTYHQQRVGPMERGSSRLVVGAMDELQRRGRSVAMLVAPVAIRYQVPGDRERTLRGLVDRLVSVGGFTPPASPSLDDRLVELTEAIVTKLEAFYGRYFPSAFEDRAGQDLQARIHGLCEAALGAGEAFVDAGGNGDLLTRVFSLRQRGWELIYRDDLSPTDAPAPLDRALLDRIADEAYHCMRHMELADILEYVQVDYIGGDVSLDRSIEYALNLLDVINRAAGGNIASRYKISGKVARLEIGAPLNVEEVCAGTSGSARVRGELLDLRLRSELDRLSTAVDP